MFEHTRQAIAERTDHPLLLSLLIIAALFVAFGFALEAAGEGVAAAFFAIFALIFAALSVIGYAVTFTVRIILRSER